MGRTRVFLLFFILIFYSGYANAQEMWGVTESNFSGSNSSLINPSLLNSSKIYMDFNLLTGDVFVQNNFAYIPANDFRPAQYLKEGYEFPTYGPDDQSFKRVDNTKLKSVISSVRLKGPSAMLVFNDHAFALHTAVRSVASGRRIPYEIANFAYEGMNYRPQWNINYEDYDFDFGAMAWGEIGGTYSYTYYKYAFSRLTAGITLKYLMGYSGGYINVDKIDYVVLNDSTLDIQDMNLDAGISLPVNYNNNDVPYGQTFKGSGLGADLGITYTRTVKGHSNQRYKNPCAQPYEDYVYRIGFSVLDLGAIRFKDNAQQHEFTEVGYYWERVDTLDYTNIQTLVNEFSNNFYGDPSASLVADRFSMMLPTAVSLQADYHYYRDLYVGAYFVYPIMFNNSYLRRPAQIAIMPRYETSEIELALPVSLYDLKYPRVGLSARIYFLTIGTEKLGSFFGLNDFTGADFYFSIKFNFRKGHCKNSRSEYCANGEYQ
ncbi:MAG: DUF5723 family protein [Bacteroidota bacterium]|nr:DUF5723 family protein [Bacteroidota bacterium]